MENGHNIVNKTRIFDPRATWVKNPFRQIEYELFFIMIFMVFCMSDWDFTSLSPYLGQVREYSEIFLQVFWSKIIVISPVQSR
jgi:hypothetical protein